MAKTHLEPMTFFSIGWRVSSKIPRSLSIWYSLTIGFHQRSGYRMASPYDLDIHVSVSVRNI